MHLSFFCLIFVVYQSCFKYIALISSISFVGIYSRVQRNCVNFQARLMRNLSYVMYIVHCTKCTDKKHNINGNLTTENIWGFFHMQEYSFLLIPVYNLLQFIIIWISVCSKIRYVLIKVHALALDTYTAVSILHSKYTADSWSLLTIQ